MTTARRLSRISWQMVVSTFSSPPGLQAELDLVEDRAGDPASSVTRATAAKPMPVVRQTTSRIVGTHPSGDGIEIRLEIVGKTGSSSGYHKQYTRPLGWQKRGRKPLSQTHFSSTFAPSRASTSWGIAYSRIRLSWRLKPHSSRWMN